MMNTKTSNIKKGNIVKAVKKSLADKEIVRAYLRKETKLQELDKKGIKLAKIL